MDGRGRRVRKRREGKWEGGLKPALEIWGGDRKRMGKRMVNTKRGNSRTRKNESRDGDGN